MKPRKVLPDKSERSSKLRTLKDLFIVAVKGQRFEPVVSHLKSLKGAVRNDFLRLLIRILCYSPLLLL